MTYVAVVLDPCFKIRYAVFCIETIYCKNFKKGKQILGKVENTLHKLFNHYKNKVEKTKA